MLFRNGLLDGKKAFKILSSYDVLSWPETEISIMRWENKLGLSFFIC